MQNVYGSRIRHFSSRRLKPHAPEPLPSTPLLRKAAISSAVAAAVMAPQAEADVTIWKPNVEIGIAAGTERSVGGISALLPVIQRADSLSYVDLRGTVTSKSTDEFNLAIGHRVVSADKNWIIGGFAGVDRRKSGSGRHYNQVTAGAEVLSDTWDFRGNLYIPVGTKKHVVGNVLSSATLVGSRFFANGVAEEAMGGFDVEMGRSLDIPGLNGETRAYLGAYHFDGKVAKDANGLGFRMEYFPQKNITVGVSVTHDNLFGSEAFLELRYSFGQDSKTGKRSLSERMTQFARRDIDVRETSALPFEERVSTDSGDRVDVTSTIAPGGFLVIDNSAAPGGTGTAENPFDSFAACNTVTAGADCQDANTVVYVKNGNSGVTPYDTLTHVMPSGQKLIGSGVEFYGVPAGTAPTVGTSNGSDVIRANNNTEVAGLNINDAAGAFRHGVYAKNVTGVTIRDNTIDSAGSHGIHLIAGNGNSMAASIVNNLIQNAGGSGIRVYAYNGSGSGTTTQSVTISGNTILNAASHGVVARSYAGSAGGAVSQTVSLSNNTIYGSGTHGVYLRNYANSGATATQVASLSGNTINYSGSDGVRINNYANDNGSTASQTVTLSNNTIHGSGSRGVYIRNTGYDYGAATQTVTLSGNSVRYSGGQGVRIINYGYGYGTATQTVSLTGNTISDNGGVGVYAYNNARGGSTATQTLTLSGNTIENNNGDGVAIKQYALNDSTATQTATLSNNTIRYNNGHGVYAYNYARNDSTATQTLTLTSNTISDNDGAGVYLNNKAGYNGTATQTLALTSNTIRDNRYDGVRLRNNADGNYSTATQTATLTDNTISDNGRNGVSARNYSNNSNAAATQTLTLTDNTISGNYGHGVRLQNEVYDSGGTTVTQTATLSGNTISDNGGYGVTAYNHGYGGGTATQTLTLTSNTISNNDHGGVHLRNVATYYDGISGTATQTATLTGNSITGNGGTGIYARNSADTDNDSATQNLTLTNNTISGASVGLYARNDVNYGYATASQTLSLSGNSITSTGNQAMRLYNRSGNATYMNYAWYGAAATQIVNLNPPSAAANTLAGGAYGYGAIIRNAANGMSTQTVTLTGSTLTGGNGSFYSNGNGNQTVIP